MLHSIILILQIASLCISDILFQAWRDYRLTWNASEFDGITKLFLPVDQLWIPDVILWNKFALNRSFFRMSKKHDALCPIADTMSQCAGLGAESLRKELKMAKSSEFD